jgi:hypothetical protein
MKDSITFLLFIFLPSAFLQIQPKNEWENPEINGQNREPARATKDVR